MFSLNLWNILYNLSILLCFFKLFQLRHGVRHFGFGVFACQVVYGVQHHAVCTRFLCAVDLLCERVGRVESCAVVRIRARLIHRKPDIQFDARQAL